MIRFNVTVLLDGEKIVETRLLFKDLQASWMKPTGVVEKDDYCVKLKCSSSYKSLEHKGLRIGKAAALQSKVSGFLCAILNLSEDTNTNQFSLHITHFPHIYIPYLTIKTLLMYISVYARIHYVTYTPIHIIIHLHIHISNTYNAISIFYKQS